MIPLIDRFFPVPDFLRMPSIGLDISDHYLKYVELVHTSRGIRIGRFGSKEIPMLAIEDGAIVDPQKVKAVLMELQKELEVDFVRASLPEEKVYLFDLVIPRVKAEDIQQAISFQIEEQVPVAKDDLIFDYDLIKEDARNYHVQVHAIPRKLMRSYSDVLTESGFTPLSFELEPQAIAQGVVTDKEAAPYLLVDFGEVRTNISVIQNKNVAFTTTVNFSGEMLTHLIEKELGLSYKEAEEAKKSVGLVSDEKSTEAVVTLLREQITMLGGEIIKYRQYWKDHKQQDNDPEKIFICGGGANMAGVIEHLAEQTKMTVEVAQIQDMSFEQEQKKKNNLSGPELLSFATAIGLALGDFKYD